MTTKRFFIITLQHAVKNGDITNFTRSGYLTGILSSATEEHLYEDILKASCKDLDFPRFSTSVLFYYLGKPEAE